MQGQSPIQGKRQMKQQTQELSQSRALHPYHPLSRNLRERHEVDLEAQSSAGHVASPCKMSAGQPTDSQSPTSTHAGAGLLGQSTLGSTLTSSASLSAPPALAPSPARSTATKELEDIQARLELAREYQLQEQQQRLLLYFVDF